jgi:uncharacterized protein YjiS (DUF1127 family)
MALSLPGERSIAAGSRINPVRALVAWIAQTWALRARRKTLQELLALDPARLRDLGLNRSDIVDAMEAGNGRTSGMILNAARSRSAKG